MPIRYPECITPPQEKLDKDDCDKDYYNYVCDWLTYNVLKQKQKQKNLTRELKRVSKLHQRMKEENKEKT